MKNLRLSLLILTMVLDWLNPVHAQTDPPFEGLRFNTFSSAGTASIPAFMHGTLTYNFQCNATNVGATTMLHITKNWVPDPNDPANLIETNLDLSIHGTNMWSVNPDTGALGSLYYRTWVGQNTNGDYPLTWEETTYYQDAIVPFLGAGNVNGQQGVSAQMDLVIAGDLAFTNDVVVMFTVSATDADTGMAIPDVDITVGGESVTNGVAWASFSEHTTNGVTPSITGHANWTASLSATIYRLELNGDGFMYLDADPAYQTNSASSNSFTVSAMAPAPGATNATGVPQIYYTYSGSTSLNNSSNRSTEIGTLLTFWVTVPAGPGMVATNYAWTIGGDTVSNFFIGDKIVTDTNGITTTQSVGQVVADYPKTNASVTFAWWKPGLHTVKFKCELNGQPASASCKINVRKPPASLVVKNSGDDGIAVGNIYTTSDANNATIKLGTDMANDRGVRFAIDGTASYTEFGWIQIINSSTRTTYRDNASVTDPVTGNMIVRTNKVVSASGLDNRAFLPDATDFTDSPGQTFISSSDFGCLGASINESFTLYLMYRPGGTGVWVPLQLVDWSWKAALTNAPGGWILNTSWPNAATNQPVNTSPGYPGWSITVTNTPP